MAKWSPDPFVSCPYSSLAHPCTHTHTHTLTHYTLTHMQLTHMHTLHTHTHAHSHTCTLTHMHTHTHAHSHTCTHMPLPCPASRRGPPHRSRPAPPSTRGQPFSSAPQAFRRASGSRQSASRRGPLEGKMTDMGIDGGWARHCQDEPVNRVPLSPPAIGPHDNNKRFTDLQ